MTVEPFPPCRNEKGSWWSGHRTLVLEISVDHDANVQLDGICEAKEKVVRNTVSKRARSDSK